MQLDITPSLIASLSTLVLALERNPVGGAYLVALTAIVMLAMRGRTK